MSKQIRTAIIGCGNIANHYAEHMKGYPEIDLAGFSDLDSARAEAFAAKFGGRTYRDLDEILADPSIELVVNLTIHHAHAEVIERCLEAGKHVHTEKPLALSSADAHRLVALADKTGLRLSSAPSNYMGEAQQTVWRVIRSGGIGTPRLVYAEVNHGRLEAWHPNPEAFYDVGILWDVSVYPLTLITTFFGPVKRVTAYGTVLYPDRVTKEGRAFRITTPDYYLAALELECGMTARLSANFYVDRGKQGGSMEFHGDGGSAFLGDFQNFDAPVEAHEYGKPYESVPLVRKPPAPSEFSRGVQDLAQAIIAGRPHRTSGVHAAHVVDTISAIIQSARDHQMVNVGPTKFTPPTPMDWSGK
ncbi:MAG: Gfo/Idh/MocA family oxidoreductase [Capsulimonadaceae bacterium]|nr:Gfo/Idh/MocA family oxidoreductase [Capsulimonadaceae bacterium]